MKFDRLSGYAAPVLRIGVAVLFLWFGFSQWANPLQWKSMVPSYALAILPLSPTAIIYLHGTFEIVFGGLLLFGLFSRLASGLLALNLLHILFVVGYGPIGVRDFALALAMLSVFMNGPDEFCLDRLKKKKENLG